MEEEEEVFTEEEVEEIKPRRVRSQRKVSMHFLLNQLNFQRVTENLRAKKCKCANVGK